MSNPNYPEGVTERDIDRIGEVNPLVYEDVVPIKDIENGMVYTILAPMIQARISGAYKAGFDNKGKITLIYEDGTSESAQFEIDEAQAIAEMGMENWFHIVGSVQDRARAEKAFSDTCKAMQGLTND